MAIDKNPVTVSNINNEKKFMNEKISLVALLVIVSLSAGFVGGYFGAKDQPSNNSREAQQQIIDNESELISQIARDVGPSVVSINTTSDTAVNTFFGTRSITRQSAGTGVIVNADGVIITNRHVISKDTTTVSITLSDGTKLDNVEVVGRTGDSDPLDIAFLKIKDKKGKELKAAKIGDSSKVEVGDKVVAIGNALGQFQNTVTSGIISGYGREIEASDGAGSESLQNLFQTDAAINEGNSGGPLVNTSGEVIGINTAVAAGGAENIGFAIPISDISGLINSVLKDGKLQRPYLGVRYVSLTDDYAYEHNLGPKRGAYLAPLEGGAPILPNSPAQKAGLQEKDVITKVDDTEINEKNSLSSALGKRNVGDKVRLTVVREGKEIIIEATLEAAPAG